jgi:hypothetical protein
MAYSDRFLDERNTIMKKLFLNLNANDSSSNNVNLGKNIQKKKECFELPTKAEPSIVNQLKIRKERKRRRYRSKSKEYLTNIIK